jgi:hypothetical protein
MKLFIIFYFYYELRYRELKTRLIYEDRWDERLKTKEEESTRLVYTGLSHSYVSLTELVNVYQVGLREPMNLCT